MIKQRLLIKVAERISRGEAGPKTEPTRPEAVRPELKQARSVRAEPAQPHFEDFLVSLVSNYAA
ncbi:MAG: hypothetical protein AMXMBFR33_30560 [Candidatus Xenobia bacterium]|jgi:hypothetical protein